MLPAIGCLRWRFAVPAIAPLYQPKLSAEDVAHAQEVARRSTSRQDHARRARLALVLADNPALTNPEAGQRVGMHPNSVRNWRKAWCQGPFRLTDLPGRGRKPRLSPLCGRYG